MKKTLQDLTIKDNFMFGAVMTDQKTAKAYWNYFFTKNWTESS